MAQRAHFPAELEESAELERAQLALRAAFKGSWRVVWRGLGTLTQAMQSATITHGFLWVMEKTPDRKKGMTPRSDAGGERPDSGPTQRRRARHEVKCLAIVAAGSELRRSG